MAKETAGVKTGTTAAGVPPAKPAESSGGGSPPRAIVMAANEDEPSYRYFRAGKEDFEADNSTFQVRMSSEFPAEQRARAEHDRLGIAKVGEKYVEILSHDEGDVDLSRFTGNNRAAVLDEHKDNRHIGYIKAAALSKDKSTRGVAVFDKVTKLSQTRCKQVLANSRPNFSIGYAQTRYLGKVALADGRTGHRFAWQALELSNVAVPADPTAQEGRGKEKECHCIDCGDIYSRSELNDVFVCEDCEAAETPVDSERGNGERMFRAKKGGEEVRISHNDLRAKTNSALNEDKRFKQKRANGDTVSDFYTHDIHQTSADATDFQAIVSSPAWRDGSKLFAVDFSYDGEAVSLGDATEVEPKTTFEAVDRAVAFDAKQFRLAAGGSPVDSAKLPEAETPAPNLNTRKMKTVAALKTEEPQLVTEIETAARTEQERTTRTAVLDEVNTKRTKIVAGATEIDGLADGYCKDFGRNWAGKPGEVVVVGEQVRSLQIKAHRALEEGKLSLSEVRNNFKTDCGELCRSSRAPKNQEEAANLPMELAARCSISRLYVAAAESQARGQRTGCFMVTEGAEFEADKELRTKAKDFPGGMAIANEGVCLPTNMPYRRLYLSPRQLRAFDRVTRDSLASNFPSAGALIAPEYKFPTIELLRNSMAMGRAGITILGGVMGNLVLPRQTSPTTSQSLAEGAILAAFDQTFDQIKMSPHRIGSKQLYSRLALLQTTEDFEALVMSDHVQQNALRADYLILNGSGGNDEPVGILNQIGIGAITFGGSASGAYKNIVALETLIRAANIDEEPTFITTSTARGTLRITPATLTGSTVVSGETNALWVGDELAGRPAVDSQQVPGDVLVALVGRHVVMAQWGGWQVVIDTLTAADQDKIKLSVNTYIDSALRHPQAVARSSDSLAILT